MNLLIVATTTGVVAAVATFGAWLGGRRIGRVLAVTAVALAGAAGAAALAWQNGWFWPCGLLTPLLVGAVVWLSVVAAGRRCWPPATSAPARGGRWLGALLGAVVGLYGAAAGWLLGAATADTLAASTALSYDEDDADVADAWRELLRTADRGFVRHLPLLGELSSEFEALVYILDAPAHARRAVVEQQQWQALAQLPSYRELLADQAIRRDLEALREGDLLALYRVQRSPRFLAFFECEAVQRVLPGLRPSLLAKSVREAAHGLAVEPR
ncbi:MAG: hypothetical protein IT455_19890 [Planctomycetes bacterium]|nr:hypothetical protein [Planctomycetota bacterium]